MEIWKYIPGYENEYMISNKGNIKSVDRFSYQKNNTVKRYIKGTNISPAKDSKGYLRVSIKGKTYKVHRLVAQTFIPNPNNFPQVNHKDENKQNNHVENLEWCTNEYNVNYGNRTRKSIKTNTNGKYSKKVYQYNLEGELIKIWPSAAECGRNGFCSSKICSVCTGRRISSHGFVWSYVPLEGNELNHKINAANCTKPKKVYQYSKNLALIKVWENAFETSSEGFSFGCVSRCCKGERKTHKGYIWSYTKL